LLLTAGVIPAQAAQAESAAPPSITLTARIEYSAKFVCGLQPPGTPNQPPSEPPVKPGNYASVINIHNPWSSTVSILKKVAVASPETYPNTKLITPTKRFSDRLLSDHAMSVDCTEIVNLLKLNGTPAMGTFVEGFLVIDSFFPAGSAGGDAALDVVAVTTTAQDLNSPVNSHEVTIVPGRSLPAGTWPF
jgi:hypothetical protein